MNTLYTLIRFKHLQFKQFPSWAYSKLKAGQIKDERSMTNIFLDQVNLTTLPSNCPSAWETLFLLGFVPKGY